MKRLSIAQKRIQIGYPIQCRPSNSIIISKKPIIKMTTLTTAPMLITHTRKYMSTPIQPPPPQTKTQTPNDIDQTTTTTTPLRHDRNIVEQNKKLAVLYKQKNLDEASEMFNTMLESNQFDIDSFNMMLELYADRGHGTQMRQLFNKLLLLGLKPGQRTYAPLLRFYYKINSFHQVINTWNTMLKEKIPLSIQNLHFVMLAFQRSQRYEEVIGLYKYMKEANLYDQSTYNDIIYACACCGKTDDVHMFYQEMQSRGILPNLKTFYNVFNALTQVQDDKKLEYYKQEMKTYNIKSNAMLYMFQLEYFAKKKDYAGVMDILVKIESDPTINMTESFVKVLVDSIGQCDRPQDMIKYVSSLEAAGVPPFLEVYFKLIQHLDRLVSPQSAIEMYKIAINHKNLVPTQELWNFMLRVYARAKDKQGVNTLLEEFRKKNIAPDPVSLQAAIELEKGK